MREDEIGHPDPTEQVFETHGVACLRHELEMWHGAVIGETGCRAGRCGRLRITSWHAQRRDE